VSPIILVLSDLASYYLYTLLHFPTLSFFVTVQTCLGPVALVLPPILNHV